MSENLPARLPALAEEINHCHSQAEAAINTALEYAMRAGELLLEVKASLPHGSFGPWLAENFRGSARTVQGYMRIARRREEIEQKRNGVADLPLRDALALLAEPKEPAPLSREERARLGDLEERIRHLLDSLDVLLADSYARRVWEPLGYPSWERYVEAELAPPHVEGVPDDVTAILREKVQELARTVAD